MGWYAICLDVLSNDGGAGGHGLHLTKSRFPREILQAAVRCYNEALGWHVDKRPVDPLRDRFGRLDGGIGKIKDPQNDGF